MGVSVWDRAGEALSCAPMKVSLKWLNGWLDGPPRSQAEVTEILTDVGFPIDGREDLPGGDVRLEVEITSNRGDCLSHEGLAREVAARLGVGLRAPEAARFRSGGGPIGALLRLEQEAGVLCPRFTARVIRGVKVGPSPAWLVERLASVGQRSINNVVDVTNFIALEHGHPCHAFDLGRLAGAALVVRLASEGEGLTTLDGKSRTLRADEVVVADGQRAQSLAGVIGGQDSEVGPSTRDVVLEMATWDPVAVRRAARRHQIRTDASHRFERFVDPRAIDGPAARAAGLIAELSGGVVCEGVLDSAPAAQPLRALTLRIGRIERVLGVAIAAERAAEILRRLGFEVGEAQGGVLPIVVPAWRHDVEREIDLIEEVARVHGLDKIPTPPTVAVSLRPPQASERAMGELSRVLTGLGFFETVTFSFVSPGSARLFLPAGLGLLSVDDSRRREEPTLRPSLIPSLLACRRANQDARVEQPGGVRLFEIAATFAEQPVADVSRRLTTDAVRERSMLALLLDVPGVGKGKPGTVDQRQVGVRLVRGALEAVAEALGLGTISMEPEPGGMGLDAQAASAVLLNGRRIGRLGLIDAAVQRQFDLAIPVAVAEVEVDALVLSRPERAAVEMPPSFPGIERDVSVIVGEDVRWSAIEACVRGSRPELMVGVAFVGTYRGKPLEAGQKSVTFRLSFRHAERTLRDEEVTPGVEAVVRALGSAVGAKVRTL